ncbi:MAG TPA: hypothetical protein VFY05_05260, partial [Candidatus Angelobacter sp.]|nr:hypothetical protein [Candidatus Angelobacter sp.]
MPPVIETETVNGITVKVTANLHPAVVPPTPLVTSPVSTQLIGGLSGAIGSQLRASHNQLIFVEFGGKLSCLNLFRPASVVSFGTTILKGTWTFNFDTGAQGAPGPDVWWDQQTNVLRQMVPQGSARIVNIGITNFNALTPATLQKLTYTTTPIAGNNDLSNRLVPGDVFAVLTNEG